MAYSLTMNPVFAVEEPVVSNISQYLTAFSIRSVGQFFPTIWQVFLILAVILALILLIIGGIQWATSGDDKEKKASAQGRITAALIGLLIVFAAWAIYGILGGAFYFPSVFQIPGGPVAGRCPIPDDGLGETCDNLNKCDINGGCNPACCATTADCPPGQYCSIPNGYCQSGKSCAGTTLYHKECRDNICVNVPGGGPDQCTTHAQCQ